MMFQNLNEIGRSVLSFEDNSYFGNMASEKLRKTCFWWDFEIVKVSEVYSKVLDYNLFASSWIVRLEKVSHKT